ncbi:MAG: PriCT-2 domain-containing protein [Magnetococcales bacterium]|nr:PriCT-2 domain-containing protein [Magnetococcales bacterium]
MDTTPNPATGPAGRGSETRQQSNFGSNSSGFRPERQGSSPTPEEITSALHTISPDCDREQWVQAGMAIKAELGDSGFAVFDGWSRGGKSYQQTDCRDTWKSIKPGGGTTIKTLFGMAKDAGWKWTPPHTVTQDKPSPGGQTGHAASRRDPGVIWAACHEAPADQDNLPVCCDRYLPCAFHPVSPRFTSVSSPFH